jgi:hypothetical protein
MKSTQINNLVQNQPPQTYDQLLSFLNGRITCKTHHNQPAKSICIDCKTFCCMVENCGQPHIYHSIENLEYLVNQQVLPLIGTLKEVNQNLSQNKAKQVNFLKTFKNNLKSFAIEEKKKIDEEYRKIINSLQIIYNSHMGDIDEFIENLSLKFDKLQERINSVYSSSSGSGSSNSPSVNEINNYVNNLITNSGNNEIFISYMSKDVKKLNQKMKEVYNNMSKFDFNKEIEELKSQAEKEYPKIDRTEYFKSLSQKFEYEKTTFLETKKKRDERKTISSMKKMVSMRQSLSPKDNYQLEIDLDIFVRYLFDEFNKLRQRPSEALRILDEYVDIFNTDESIFNPNQSNLNESSTIQANFNSKFSFIYEYLNNLVANRISLPPFEWDNDLSNSAEDYLKLSSGKIEKDHNVYLSHIKEIINTNYYSQYLNINSMHYTGAPELNKIIMNILLNELYWDTNIKENFIFTKNYNVMGICGTAGSSHNRVVLVMNVSLLNK